MTSVNVEPPARTVGPSKREKASMDSATASTPRARHRFSRAAWPIGTILVTLGAWELLSRTETVDPIVLPPFSDVMVSLTQLVQESYFWTQTKVTMIETLLGLVIGVVGAWIAGTLIGLFRVARLALYPIVVAFQTTPRVVFAPVFLVWFGFGLASKYMMVAGICFFPVLIAVIIGLETVDKDAQKLMRSFGASRWQTYRTLSLPSSLPIVFGGIKQAVTLALVGAIVAEFVAGTEGMGVMVQQFNFQLQVADAFAVIVALMLIGLLLYGLAEWIDRKVVFWRGH